MAQTLPMIVHIHSCRYSGSTWLNLLLGAHRAVLSVGELDGALELSHPVCMAHDRACALWNGVDLGPLLVKPLAFFGELSRRSGRQVLVLNNAPRSLRAATEAGMAIKHIVLLRDGRAVAASELRKNKGLSMRRAARRWKRRTIEILNIATQSEGKRIRYEALCEDTPGELARLCRFLNIPYEPSMTHDVNRPRCFLGGNLGTQLATAGELPRETLDRYAKRDSRDWGLDFYKGADPRTFRDERWRGELSAMQRGVFALVAGRLNRALGYRSAATMAREF